MPVLVECPTCGLKLKAPDSAMGKQVRCSGCKAVLTVPDDRPSVEASAPPEVGIQVSPAVSSQSEVPASEPGAGGGERKPCPMCGELIAATAAKCRFCGEVFDPELRRMETKKKSGATDADMTTGDWVVALLCSGIGCIAGIIWMIQGKPKGGKMLAVSFVAGVFWGIVRVAITAAVRQ